MFRWQEKLLMNWEVLVMHQPVAESQCKQDEMQPSTSSTMFPSLAHRKITAASSLSVMCHIPPVGYFKKNINVSFKTVFKFYLTYFQ